MLVRRRRLAHVHVQAAQAGMVRHVGLLRHPGPLPAFPASIAAITAAEAATAATSTTVAAASAAAGP